MALIAKMLKVRSLRFIFLVFFVSIAITCILFSISGLRSGRDLPSPLPRAYETHGKIASSDGEFLDDQRVSIFLNYSQTISIQPFLIEPFLLYNQLDKQQQSYFISKNLNPHVFRWKTNFNTFGLKIPAELTKEASVLLRVACLQVITNILIMS